MSIFKDRVYEDMDWLEKACTPIVCELNDLLNELPNEIVLTYEDVLQLGISSYGGGIINADSVLALKTTLHNVQWDDWRKILECFEMMIDGEPILDLKNQTLTNGRIKIIKIKESFEEKELESMLGLVGFDKYLSNISYKNIDIKRLNNVVELLGLHEARRSRSPRAKLDAIKREIINIMSENRWDIRDIKLSDRISLWLNRYLVEGNLAAYANFCKLKVMTHDDQPIYSIEGEEKV